MLLSLDIKILEAKEKEYDSSWLKRGGTGAYHQGFGRKVDRIEAQAARHNYDLWEAIRSDPRAEGIMDDIGDLRRYLALYEAQAIILGLVDPPEKSAWPVDQLLQGRPRLVGDDPHDVLPRPFGFGPTDGDQTS